MVESGLSDLIPQRKMNQNGKISQAKSLSARANRSMDNWVFNLIDLDEDRKKKLVALIVKISIIVLMDSTCYTFGGEIY